MKLNKYTNEELENRAQNIVKYRQELDVELLLIFAEIKKRKIDLLAGYSGIYDYCERKLGLSKGQANKRKQAVKTIEIAPETIQLLKDGKTHISNLALLAPKITSLNKETIISFLPSVSKEKLAFFLQTIDRDGNTIAVEPKIEIIIKCTQEMIDKINRLQGLLVQSHGETNKEMVIDRALDALINKIDPIKKQERREQREKKVTPLKAKPVKNISRDNSEKRHFNTKDTATSLKQNEYQCTFVGLEGVRCQEKSALQQDHIVPWSQGGKSQIENARTLCFSHNRLEADRLLGQSFMANKIRSALQARPGSGETSNLHTRL